MFETVTFGFWCFGFFTGPVWVLIALLVAVLAVHYRPR